MNSIVRPPCFNFCAFPIVSLLHESPPAVQDVIGTGTLRGEECTCPLTKAELAWIRVPENHGAVVEMGRKSLMAFKGQEAGVWLDGGKLRLDAEKDEAYAKFTEERKLGNAVWDKPNPDLPIIHFNPRYEDYVAFMSPDDNGPVYVHDVEDRLGVKFLKAGNVDGGL